MGRPSMVNQRRREILDAFYKLARTGGLKGADIRTVARKAGLKPSLIYHYFENKEEIVEQLVQFAAQERFREFENLSRNATDGKELLRLLADSLFNEDIISDDSGMFYDIWGEAKRNVNLERMHNEVYRAFRGVIVDVMKRQEPAPGKTDKDYEDFAFMAVSLFLGVYIQADFERGAADLEAMRRLFLAAAEDFLKG